MNRIQATMHIELGQNASGMIACGCVADVQAGSHFLVDFPFRPQSNNFQLAR